MSALSEKANRFSFKILGGSFKTLVVEVTLSENVSAPYQADLVLASEDAIQLDGVVGKAGLLTIVGAAGDRLTHGVINRFAQTGKRGRFLLYEASLVPQLWLLSQRRNSRIFQNDAVKDIVGKVLKADQVPADHAVFRLKEKYQPKEYAVQYQESDLAFISRQAEEDGIWFFFEQSKDKGVVVFADSKSAYKPIEGDAGIAFKQAEGMPQKEEVVYQLAATQTIVPGKMSQNDFNYIKPSTSLGAQEQGQTNTALEIYEHPGRYQEDGDGKRLTKTRLEELTAMQQTVRGFSTCPRLSPGYTFKLKNHETSALNQEYLVVAVTHHGKEGPALQEVSTGDVQSYYNEFTAIPSSVTLRPPRATPRPFIAGAQTAIVVGPKGEEIYTDDAGRVKVKFHWDRAAEKNEKSSCWMRVSQPWTGEGWGAMFLPRIGQEVIVSFLDGDPDRPIVTGRVYNGANPVPHGLPASKTKSSIMTNSTKGGGGSNELTFDDAKGSEMILLHGQKDLTVNVGNDKSESVGHDETHHVTHDETHTVGNDETHDVTGKVTHTIGKDETHAVGGNQTFSVKGNRDKRVTKDETSEITGNQTIGVTGTLDETIKTDENSTVIGNRTDKTGGVKKENVTLAAFETIGLAKTLSVGAAYQVSVIGLMNESVALAKTEQVGKVKSVVVKGGMFEKVMSSRSMSTTNTHTIKAKEIIIEASSSIVIKVGKASIGMKDDGTIEIIGKKVSKKGSEVVVDASKSLTLTGKKITHN